MRTLAACLAEREDELRADLQEFYGIDLDAAMGGGHSAPHVAALVAQLPPASRLAVAADPDNAWTTEAVMLAAIFNSFQAWQWAQMDRRRRGQMPERVGPSWMRRKPGERKVDAQVMSVAQLMRKLGIERREVQDG